MDYKDYPFQYSALDISWNFAQRPGIKTESIRETQATMGNSNTDNSLLRLNIVLAVSPPNSKSGLFPKGASPWET